MSTINDFMNELPPKGIERAIEVVRLASEDEAPRVLFSHRQTKRTERDETGPRAHWFSDLTSLKTWAEKYATENSTFYVDVSNEKVHLVLDESAAYGCEVVDMDPVLHPHFDKWRGMTGPWLNLKDAVWKLRGLARTFADRAVAQLMLAHLENVTIDKSVRAERSGKSVGRDALIIETKIKGQGKVAGEDISEIPEVFKLRLDPYVGGSSHEAEILMELCGNSNHEVMVRFTCLEGWEVFLQNAWMSWVDRVKLDEVALTVQGAPAWASWSYKDG